MKSGPRNAGITRRQLFRIGTAVLTASGIASLGGSRSEAADKISKSLAEYQDSPKDGHRCSACKYYLGNGECSQVAGEISPDGWCMLWTAKS